MTGQRQSRVRQGRLNRRQGQRGEWLARQMLRFKGYRILAAGEKAAGVEVDIVAVRGKALVLVEVKSRKTMESARYAVSAAQRQRLERAAAILLQRHRGKYKNIRFDVILLGKGSWPRHIENAWRPAA